MKRFMQYKVFGCKTNKYFTEKWLSSGSLADKKGMFIASCIVTDRAKSKWLKFVKDTISGFQTDDEKIYLSGCGTIKNGKLDENFYDIYPELKEYKCKIVLLGEDPEKENTSIRLDSIKKRIIYTRKYLIIQNGCDNYCTFCLTIQARGGHNSRDVDSIISEIQDFSSSGGKEIVLTGTNIGAWGASDTKKFDESKLHELLEEILEKTTMPRIRISSLGIEYISERLLKIFSNPRIYPHFHLSIQSGSDKILKSMNRNYSEKKLNEILERLNDLKRMDGILPSIGADMIIGFPGESQEDFEKSLNLLEKYNITKLHAFPFSSHKSHYSIPAGAFPNQIDDKIKRERMDVIGKEANRVRECFQKKNDGKSMNMLVEKIGDQTFSGWSENYILLNQENFTPSDNQEIKRGNIIEGIFNLK
ncbi:MAG: radical SAM protein [Candidatus Gracilibacteria bacterium]|nr:radical SAM protein [Candidatus Gracilibacteria bacterium]